MSSLVELSPSVARVRMTSLAELNLVSCLLLWSSGVGMSSLVRWTSPFEVFRMVLIGEKLTLFAKTGIPQLAK